MLRAIDFPKTRMDLGVREIGHLQPRLREDVTFASQRYGGDECYIVEDILRSRYYRIGISEYRFISLLDGNRTIAQAISEVAIILGPDALTERDAAVICQWLIDTQLACTEESTRPERLVDEVDKRRRDRAVSRFNLLFFKIPLVNPDRALSLLLPGFRILLSRFFFLVWVIVVSCGLYHVVANWERFTAESAGVLAVNNWLWLLLVWSVLKIIHEFFHGLFCKKYGGSVYEAGIILILFAPIGYVDATSSWRFTSKWQRIFTSSAGMYIELFIAGAAAWIWADTSPGTLNHLAYNVVLIASVSTLLFNANPLMKFDGYYIFSDLVEIPNLYGEGQQFLKYLARKYLLGVGAKLPQRSFCEAMIIKTYGVAALLWRVVVIVTLLIIANTLFYGAGLVIAGVSASALLGIPMVRFIKYLLSGNNLEKPSIRRFVVMCTVLVLGLYLVVAELTWSSRLTAPAIVEFSDLTQVRVDSPGFVEHIAVTDGQWVSKGDVLITLRSDELDAQAQDLALRLQQLELRKRSYLHDGDLAAVQIIDGEANAVAVQHQEILRLLAGMTIRAPTAGRILTARINGLQDRYLARGYEVTTIAPHRSKTLQVSIDQRHIDEFRHWVNHSVDVRLNSRPDTAVQGVLTDIRPRASTNIEYGALAAAGGGPIPVTVRQSEPSRSTAHYESQYRFIDPRFTAEVEMSDVVGS
ncbi:MAG: efflux RND transporter periplasmic adaptor subunit, partial [Gammaproteobacteria bacterium]|nr:efflux RND transporter periplasmic adaptor subunit [Gammaproteobacteria bacterium]